MELKPVFIKWIDTISDPEDYWKNVELTNDFFDRNDNTVFEVGFVWDEDENYLYLVSKYIPSDIDNDLTLTSGRTKIPKKWILERNNTENKT